MSQPLDCPSCGADFPSTRPDGLYEDGAGGRCAECGQRVRVVVDESHEIDEDGTAHAYLTENDYEEDEKMIAWKDYVGWTRETAVYPGAGDGSPEGIFYLALGLAGETLEVADKLEHAPADVQGLVDEVGDVAWYLARLCDELAIDVEDKSVEVRTFNYLAGRVGRVAEAVKKAQRKGGAEGVRALRGSARAVEVLGEAFDALQGYAWGKSWTLTQVLERNREKLLDRKARSVIQGEGDRR